MNADDTIEIEVLPFAEATVLLTTFESWAPEQRAEVPSAHGLSEHTAWEQK